MAIALLGGNVSTASVALDVTYQCVYQWPDELQPNQERMVVYAVAWRDPICRARLKKLGLLEPDFTERRYPLPPPPPIPMPYIPPQLRDI